MNTPEWYGSIGIMNSAHMSRRGLRVMLHRGIRALRYALATLGRHRSPACSQGRRARGTASA
ncbi:MAG: hypothetical protein JNM75_03970 [Rhodospirillales bacterium]|nr:hypothetical protein [Rhodospirillales bacterium]